MSTGVEITISGDNIIVLQGVYGQSTGAFEEVFKKSGVNKIGLSFDKSYVVVTTTRELRFCHEAGHEADGILWVEKFNGAAYVSAEALYNAMKAVY